MKHLSCYFQSHSYFCLILFVICIVIIHKNIYDIMFFVIAMSEDFGFNEATFPFVEWGATDVSREIDNEDDDPHDSQDLLWNI